MRIAKDDGIIRIQNDWSIPLCRSSYRMTVGWVAVDLSGMFQVFKTNWAQFPRPEFDSWPVIWSPLDLSILPFYAASNHQTYPYWYAFRVSKNCFCVLKTPPCVKGWSRTSYMSLNRENVITKYAHTHTNTHTQLVSSKHGTFLVQFEELQTKSQDEESFMRVSMLHMLYCSIQIWNDPRAHPVENRWLWCQDWLIVREKKRYVVSRGRRLPLYTWLEQWNGRHLTHK